MISRSSFTTLQTKGKNILQNSIQLPFSPKENDFVLRTPHTLKNADYIS